MSHRRWPLRVIDIIQAAEEIGQFTAGLSFDQFLSDKRTAKAVVADIIIIGEAASHMPDEIMQRYPQIPWRVMNDMRNVMVHVYFSIDLREVWDTATRDVPSLIAPLRKLLADEGCDATNG